MTLILLLHAIGARAETPPSLQLVAPEFIPLQMSVDGAAKGYVVELIEEAARRIEADHPIRVEKTRILPWRRAINLATTPPNIAFFSLSRTPEREDKFLWVDEVSPYEIFFFRLKARKDIQPTTLEEIRDSGHRVGVKAQSNTEELLKRMGFQKGSDYVAYSHYSFGIRMLFKHRFAMLPLTSFLAPMNVCRLGFPGHAIQPVVRVDSLSKPLWMVLSKGTPPELVERFRTVLATLKKEGLDRRLRERHLADLRANACVTENMN